MTLTSRQKVLWLASAGAGCVVLVLLLSPAKPPQPQLPDLRISGPPQMTNGAMLVSVLLSNGTSRNLNIVDDGAGNPFFVLDVGSSNLPGTIGTGLGPLANTLKLNLAPGATLSNAVWLTNPPPRFRLLVEVRDLAAERRRAFAGLLRFLAVKARLRKQPAHGDGLVMLPASAWIETDKISATVQTRPVVVLASSETGSPQLDYSGPGALNFRHSFGSFSFEIGPVGGKPWITANGEIAAGTNSAVTISVHSDADRAYDIQIWGVSTNGANLPEDKAKETVTVKAGNQSVQLRRFVIWTYDFARK